ncbi:hypothetical protein HYFRA_00005295 [Hymenoscyphus fraxineus]|uniref:Uncharacterized protein n=1 Tax=Hymenoscyphus fraxineus TaxID=746836 RepID=A0A9N9Q1Z0_9HELO|nr:hypothetical protein HYFRA_00005295 [Hymenoscyphus fraxineus]
MATMNLEKFATFAEEIRIKIFLFCLLLLPCDGSGGILPFRNLLLALVTGMNSGSQPPFLEILYNQARDIYYEKYEYYLGTGGKLYWKASVHTFFDKLLQSNARKIGSLTIDLPQCHRCSFKPGGHDRSSSRRTSVFRSSAYRRITANRRNTVPVLQPCIKHNYITALENYLKKTTITNLSRLSNLRALTIHCAGSYAPLAVRLINTIAQNAPLLKRVVLIVPLPFKGQRPSRAIMKLNEYHQRLIATINGNFVGAELAKSEKEVKVLWRAKPLTKEILVWKAEGLPANGLKLVTEDKLVWEEKDFVKK